MSKVLITTVPFGDQEPLPLKMLKESNIDYLINPIGRKLSEHELCEMISDFDVVIAGTEPITENVLKHAKKLKLISRVGIGLDSVDLLAAKRKGVKVSYTPDAPAPAVAELTLGIMLILLRKMHIANSQMHNGNWNRYFGKRISEVQIGIIGAGRIGGRILKLLEGLGVSNVLVNDINYTCDKLRILIVELVEKDIIYRKADLISLHIPLNKDTRNLIGYKELKSLKSDAMLINCSRGGIVSEKDLARVLNEGHLSGAAIDVFETEPYMGELKNIERCFLTSHMGSMSLDCRSQMEIEATEEAIRFIKGDDLLSEIPQDEYEI